MAPALGATLTMPAASALMVFAALGLGMAFPFLLISLVPAARKLLPKPGAWMIRFKQFLAFPMLATAAWLMWVLSHTSGDMGLIMALVGALLVAWLIWWAHGTHYRGLRKVLLLLTAFIIAWATLMQPSADGITLDAGMEPYSAERLAALRAEGRPVFVDATADWCLTCKVNERLALKDADTSALFKEKNVVLMVADWTRRDAAITEYLASFGRNGVPLYVYYAPQEEPLVLPQLLTPGIVQSAIAGNE
jgi:thiol:disulfide interchange protein DsbD